MANSIEPTNLAALGIASSTQRVNPNEDMGQEDFLELMVAQMRNQNPLEPQSNTEFLGQMAQFSTVDGIQGLQESFSSFATSLSSNQALQASSLVGRKVSVATNVAELSAGGNVSGSAVLPASVSSLKISVYDASGNLVRNTDMGIQAAGKVPFSWDGTNDAGTALPAGVYQIQAEGISNGSAIGVATNITTNVNSVTIAKDGNSLQLNLGALGAVSLDKVKEIF